MKRNIVIAIMAVLLGTGLMDAAGAEAQTGCRVLSLKVTSEDRTGPYGSYEYWRRTETVKCGTKTIKMTTDGYNYE